MKMKKNSGFTLLELIIVLFLISLITGMSTVFFANTLPSHRFNATVREIVASMRYARSLAQAKGENETISIDMDSRRYTMPGRGERTLPPDVNIKVVDPVSGEITTGRYELIFPGFGGAEGGTIILWDKKRVASISLDPVVGTAVVRQTENANY
jgi:prepilin-type N-terminal cleavage/methylation domain-containing protein